MSRTELGDRARVLIDQALSAGGRTVVVTGAGVSAESGIPTFRGPEGYWTVGSKHFRPEDLATQRAFRDMPWEVWSWYLFRRGVCRKASPNAGHQALVELEELLQDRFVLITQNVDGIHLRAGNSLDRTYQIHGNIDFMRCADECTDDLYRVPELISIDWPKDRRVDDAERSLLVCPSCGGRARPHVLWFDEAYDEVHFRFDSSIRAAGRADLVIIAGTSGATSLPVHVAEIAAQRGVVMLAVNLEESPFTELAERLPKGAALFGQSGSILPEITSWFRTHLGA
ncbi:MAG: RNA polymerase subunit sigma [Deltaproteobacteria bacterium]|nr:RNA polymerase subunit sigma [Deltaproteobacteria bacterium]